MTNIVCVVMRYSLGILYWLKGLATGGDYDCVLAVIGFMSRCMVPRSQYLSSSVLCGIFRCRQHPMVASGPANAACLFGIGLRLSCDLHDEKRARQDASHLASFTRYSHRGG